MPEALAAASSYAPMPLDSPREDGDSSLADMHLVHEDVLADRLLGDAVDE